MDIIGFFRITKRKTVLCGILAILMNLVFGPFGVLAVETVDGGYTAYKLGFPFSSNIISPFGWDWNPYDLFGNIFVAYTISCLFFHDLKS